MLTLLDLAISWRLQANPSLESMELVTAPDFARLNPSASRACGKRTVLASFLSSLDLAPFLDNSIFSPAADLPKAPVTATKSPGFAPLLRTSRLGLATPTPIESITRSLDSPVSPPIILQLYSDEPFARPAPISRMPLRPIEAGRPSDIIRAIGLTPFAAKSLTVATTAFLAACQ